MRHDHAATVLAGCAPRKIGPLLEAVLTERPDAAAPLLQSLPPVLAGRAADHMDPARTAAILTSLPPSGATQILNGADVRTAAEVIMKLPSAASAALISTMPGDRAASVLEFVRPAAVAALLAVSEELNGRLLARLKPPFRALVMRHLPSGGPVLSRLSD